MPMLGRARLGVLLLVLAGAGWLHLQPGSGPALVQAVVRADPSGKPSGPPPPSARSSIAPERSPLEPAQRDPFAGDGPAPVAPVAVQALVIPAPPAASPAPPLPPPLDMAFAGRLTGPDGRDVVYLSHGGDSVPIIVGQTLPNGYSVRSITSGAVELAYPGSDHTARIALPEAPTYQIR